MNQSTISTSTTTTTTASAASAPPPTKQGFRFHKSGSISPIPSPSSVVHQPSQQQQLALHTTSGSHSTTTESSNSSTRGGGGGSSGIEIQTLPTGIDHKLYQIVKRIVVATPSLLISSSSSGK